jgi:MYXO-CTERM domain-containing protein
MFQPPPRVRPGAARLSLALVVLLTVIASFHGARAATPGDVVITEIMVAPPTDGSAYREWFEIYVTNSLSLEDCWLRRSPTADPADADQEQQIDGVGTVWAEQYLLFARDEDYVVGDQGDADAVAATFSYDYFLSFSNTEPFHLFVVCDEVVIDAIEMDWSLFNDDCEGNGCAVALRAERLSASANDLLPSAWCLPPAELTFVNSAGDVATGTPGAANECRVEARPQPGDVAFTELMLTPGETPVWFELHNAADHSVLLEDCLLRRGRTDDPEDADYTTLVAVDGAPLHLHSGETRVFAAGSCLDADPDDLTDASCPYDEVLFDGATLPADGEHRLELACPPDDGESSDEVTVDEVTYQLASFTVEARHSLQFVPDDPARAAEDNDRWTDWCPAVDAQCFMRHESEVCEYGTPGTLGECLAGPVEEVDDGCACRTAGRQSPAPTSMLLGLLLWAVFSRRRPPKDGR